MARYIDADYFKEVVTRWGNRRGATEFAKAICEVCDCFPTADVVEVVRCKNCRMSRETEDEEYLFCMQFADTVHADAFCSCGERKEQ